MVEQQSNQPTGADSAQTVEWEFTVPNKHGLHLRALQLLVAVTSKYKSHLEARNITMDDAWINAKSIMGLTLLQGARDTRVGIRASGEDAAQAVEEIKQLVERKFDED